MNLFNKSFLTTVVTLSTASVYFAQQKKDTADIRSKNVEEVVLVGRNLTSVAKERKTPVAISTIKAAEIQDRLGNREFPEIVKSTPSVYVTKTGGGFGDGRINIRGFEQTNIAVLINGQPVNDMENGAVYWSNWSGLGDIASTIQIQRGLGASKLVLPSVGGTFNVVTKATDKEQGGLVKVDAANNSFLRLTAAYNTGMSKSGWATSVLLSRWQGDGYINGTKGEGYTWFFSTGYKLNDKHQFNLMATGAPQIHNTRRTSVTGLNTPVTIALLNKYGIDYNPQTGSLMGKEYNVAPNFYHKPIASFNWDYQISDKLKASTVIYASWGRGGGGTGVSGSIKNAANQTMDFINDGANGDGTINWDMVYNYNTGQTVTDYNGNVFVKTPFVAPAGAPANTFGNNVVTYNGTNGIVRRQGVNSHNWYGGIVDLNYKVNSDFTINGGVDLRAYRGIHYDIVTDLLGSNALFVKINSNVVTPNGYYVNEAVKPAPFTKLSNNQKVSYDNDGIVNWAGVYGQVEYSKNNLSAFFQGSLSRQSFAREDRMNVPSDKAVSETSIKPGHILKTGANYNFDSHHNAFFNIGKISRQPNFGAIFPNNKQLIRDAANEDIFSIELGYGFKSKIIDVNVNLYRTSWDNRFLTRSFTATAADVAKYSGLTVGNSYAFNAVGLGQLHQGLEIESKARPAKGLTARAMLSLGNWKYNGNAGFDFIDNNTNTQVNTQQYTLNVDGLKVGDAAQITSSVGLDYNIFGGFSMDANWEFYDNLYAQFNPIFFTSEAERSKGVIKLPSYNLFDLGASYKWKMKGKNELYFRANVFNIFDTKYLSEITSNVRTKTVEDFTTAGVVNQAAYDNYLNNNVYKGIDTSNNGFFGFGRTWSFSASYRF